MFIILPLEHMIRTELQSIFLHKYSLSQTCLTMKQIQHYSRLQPLCFKTKRLYRQNIESTHHRRKYHSDLLLDWFGLNQTCKAETNSRRDETPTCHLQNYFCQRNTKRNIKIGHRRSASFSLIFIFSNTHYNFMKKLHPVHGAEIRTHDLP